MVLMPLLSRLLTLLVILTMPLFLARLTLIPIKSLSIDRKSGSAGMPRPISYAVFCLKKKKHTDTWSSSDACRNACHSYEPLNARPDQVATIHAAVIAHIDTKLLSRYTRRFEEPTSCTE